MAQWERAGPITQRSVDRNYSLLKPFSHVELVSSCLWLQRLGFTFSSCCCTKFCHPDMILVVQKGFTCFRILHCSITLVGACSLYTGNLTAVCILEAIASANKFRIRSAVYFCWAVQNTTILRTPLGVVLQWRNRLARRTYKQY